ncbi:unnamed protein product [Choristocarpus tenellus]
MKQEQFSFCSPTLHSTYLSPDQVFSDWVTQTVRLRKGSRHVELEWTVGPVPVSPPQSLHGEKLKGMDGCNGLRESKVRDRTENSDDRGQYEHKDNLYKEGRKEERTDLGKEVVSRFSVPGLASEGIFYTDSNGREFQQRVRGRVPSVKVRDTGLDQDADLKLSQPVAGNFYPVTVAAFVQDVCDMCEDMGDVFNSGGRQRSGVQLTVLTDRAQGASSLSDGHLELLTHRRLLTEDQRGVGEALNETDSGMSHYPDWERRGQGEIFRGTHYLMISRKGEAMGAVRQLMDEVFSPFVTAFGEEEDGEFYSSAGINLVDNTLQTHSTVAGLAEDEQASYGNRDEEEEEEGINREVPEQRPSGTGSINLRKLSPQSGVLQEGLIRSLPPSLGLMTLMVLPPGQAREEEWSIYSREAGGLGQGRQRHSDDWGGDIVGGEVVNLLIRLTHRFAIGEDSILSQPATVDLGDLLLGYNLLHAEEVSLTGTPLEGRAEGKVGWQNLRWKTKGKGSAVTDLAMESAGEGSTSLVDGERGDEDGSSKVDRDVEWGGYGNWLVTLQAMQIKTFRLVVIPQDAVGVDLQEDVG